MKRFLFILLFVPILLSAQNKVIDHKISQVTIFLNGVNLKSEGDLFLKKGKHVIEFRNLCESMNSSTVRIGMDRGGVSLGRDKKVIVERKKREDLNSKKLIGTNRKVALAYEISVKNTDSEQIHLKLQDQIPISQESNILVDVKEISGAEQDELSGTLTWDLTLEPQESAKKILKVEVKYPRNKMVLIRKPQYMKTRF